MPEQRTVMLVFGEQASGKSQLLNRVIRPNALFAPANHPTIAADYITTEPCDIWDASGDTRYRGIIQQLAGRASLGLLCLDLGNNRSRSAFLQDCQNEMAICPASMRVIIVGTRHDLTDDETLDAFVGLYEDLRRPVYGLCVTSAKTADGLSNLRRMIRDAQRMPDGRLDMLRQRRKTFHDPMTTAIALTGVVGRSSLMHERLCELNRVLLAMDEPLIRKRIGLYAETMIRALQDPEYADKEMAITDFIRNSKEVLYGPHPWLDTLLKVLFLVAVTAVVTLVAAIVGFTIGFVAGAWAGPVAFLSGLATGTGVALLVGIAISGLVTAALTGCGLFRNVPQNRAIQRDLDEVALTAILSDESV